MCTDEVFFSPPKKGLKLSLEKYDCPETSKINVLRPESYYIPMKYIGAKRMPLTLPTICETCA